MKKVAYSLLLALLLLTTGTTAVWAEKQPTPEIERLAHSIYHHAKAHNSDIGMYFATFTLGTIREESGNMGLAEKSFLQALKLKEKYLPDESAAPCYLGLCEVALHRKDYNDVQENARKALDEPSIIPMNQTTAWSYKCLARYNQGIRFVVCNQWGSFNFPHILELLDKWGWNVLNDKE